MKTIQMLQNHGETMISASFNSYRYNMGKGEGGGGERFALNELNRVLSNYHREYS